MHVKKIELIGFKSFSDRTVFNLHPGITCIVGPNGCGKSNIVDSFKWVLGEQSAKSLRGENMQEVIFVGSQGKKPRGMAEVALHVSGLGGPDNGKDALTTVTRRLYRSGDSDYLLNNSVCRLRDIRDIFLDTGLEVKSYSILEQDRIAALLTAKPEERRFLIEEVAGVVKYRVRRSEAQSKLESSRRNIERINDVIGEIKRQINSLDRQVRKAERYRKLMEELRAVELKLARHDYGALGEALSAILARCDDLAHEEAGLRAELSRKETELETRRIALLEREKALDALQSELQGTEKEMAELERSLAVLKTETDGLRERTSRLNSEEGETGEKLRASEARLLEIASTQSELDSETQSLRDALGESSETLSLDENEIAGAEKTLDARRKDAFGVSEALSRLRSESDREGAYIEGLRKRQETVGKETDDLESHIQETHSLLARTGTAMGGQKDVLLALNDERDAVSSGITAKKEAIESMRGGISRTREELASALSRLESLREMVSADSGELGADIRVVSSVADAIEVSEEFELAIESALREVITGFILPTYDDVRLAVSALKEKGSGRTAFMPLEAEGRKSPDALPEGAVAWASDLLRSKDEFAPAIGSLLSGVLVTKDLDAALGIKGFVVCTLGGEVVEPSGAVIAGKSSGILTIKRQIRELEAETGRLRAKAEAMNEELDAALKALDESESALRAVLQRAADAEKEISLLALTAEKLKEELQRSERKLSHLRGENELAAQESDALKDGLRQREAEARGLEEQKGQIEREMSSIIEAISGMKASYEKKRAESTDLRVSLSSCTERLNSLENEKEATGGLVFELKEKLSRIAEQKTKAALGINEKEAESEGKNAVLRELALKAGGLSGRIASERDELAGESESMLSEERGLKELRGGIEEIARKLSGLEVEKAEHRLRMENLKEGIRNAYGSELDLMDESPVSEEDRETVPEIKKKIEALGPVSLGSIEEYEELRKRYEFLTKQQDDLNRSIAELEEAIRRINITTRKKLSEAFEALRAKFQEVFGGLFGGGKADLVLTEPENILETGIDIVVQPPGKRLQNMSLLSGGEKTLTAIALLFSGFLIKPTPLCILDEADAALDEANTEKFSQLLRSLSAGIQFLVVTHNKVTMEAADYIYGITMEEPGVSKVISMELAGK